MVEFFIGNSNSKIFAFQANIFVCLMIIVIYVVIKAINSKNKSNKDE